MKKENSVMKSQSRPKWAIHPRVPEEMYTDRKEFLEFFYTYALQARDERSHSTVLLGMRRMGKTEIFLRVVNRLFWEQDHRDPQAVIPVYYSFEDRAMDRWEFALDYVDNFLRWFAGFRLREPQILDPDAVPRDALLALARERLPMTSGLQGTLNLFRAFPEHTVGIPERVALQQPVKVSDRDEIPIAVFLDEFQNTRLSHENFSVVGYMQKAVESLSCPHFVTGSAMSILTQEIIGRGALFGRFDGERIEPMTQYWGAELALKAARSYHVDLPELMAPVVADRCGGNPFYITAVVRQAGKQHKAITNEATLNELLAVDLSSGFIWGELDDQVSKWIKRINEYGITKWVLYLSALEEEDRLDLVRIQRELRERDGKEVPLDTIRDVLIKLSRGDLLECSPSGSWFRKVDDPILIEFLKVWGRVEVEGQQKVGVQRSLRNRYRTLERRFHEYKGYLGEVFMAQVLWNAQRRTLPGQLFHCQEDVTIPWLFDFIRHRMRLQSGTGQEIDLIAAAGGELWVCQSKWRADPVGINVLRDLEAQGKAVDEDMEAFPLRVWLFTYSGLHGNAETYAKEHGILWSGKAEFDELLKFVGLRPLPDFSGQEKS
jgi:hypothetical protein